MSFEFICLQNPLFLSLKFLKSVKLHRRKDRFTLAAFLLFQEEEILKAKDDLRRLFCLCVFCQESQPVSVPFSPPLRPLRDGAQHGLAHQAWRDLDPVDLANHADEMLLSTCSPSASIKAIWEQCAGLNSCASLLPYSALLQCVFRLCQCLCVCVGGCFTPPYFPCILIDSWD